MGIGAEVHTVGDVGDGQIRILQQMDDLESGVILDPGGSGHVAHRIADLRKIFGRDAEFGGIEGNVAPRRAMLLDQSEIMQEGARCVVVGAHVLYGGGIDVPDVKEKDLKQTPDHISREERLFIGKTGAELPEVVVEQRPCFTVEREDGIHTDEDVPLCRPDHLRIVKTQKLRRHEQEVRIEVIGIAHVFDGVAHLPDHEIIRSGRMHLTAVGESHLSSPDDDVHMIATGEIRREATIFFCIQQLYLFHILRR